MAIRPKSGDIGYLEKQQNTIEMTPHKTANLKRSVGLFGAVMMGLGSIVGTGVFVSIAISVSVAGVWALLAIALASIVAICNGLSSAQLAANHPVSGGTYEYGHRWCSPRIGFVAGWMFLFAKSASAAAASLGFSGYVLQLAGVTDRSWLVPLALAGVALVTVITLIGILRTSLINSLIVAVTLTTLAFFVVAGLPNAWANVWPAEGISGATTSRPNPLDFSMANILYATALMFVAYTGYGRIATLGEEIDDPRRNIPRAIIVTLLVSMLLYVSVGFVVVFANQGSGNVAEISVPPAARPSGSEGLTYSDMIRILLVTFNSSTIGKAAPLHTIANGFGIPWAGTVLAVGAITAMLGVLLNLILGLSRVLLAMGRRAEMPTQAALVGEKTGVPWVATLIVAAIISLIVLVGDVQIAWSFSAFAVLIYYSITNLCALRMKPSERIFPIWPAWIGLASCLFLAFWVQPYIWANGLALLALGLLWQRAAIRLKERPSD